MPFDSSGFTASHGNSQDIQLSGDIAILGRSLYASSPEEFRELILRESGAFVLIDKPYGETSFYAVNGIRRALRDVLKIKRMKVGHAGTLDPLATGLILIATQKATKELAYLVDLDKTYRVTLRLGIDSPSFDLETMIESNGPVSVTQAEVISCLSSFVGEQDQLPPIYSAIKQQGKPIYLRARRGDEVTVNSRRVTITSISEVSCNFPYVSFLVRCGKGTYIRSLAFDIGVKLGTGAVLTSLVRTAIGAWSNANAISLTESIEVIRAKTDTDHRRVANYFEPANKSYSAD